MQIKRRARYASKEKSDNFCGTTGLRKDIVDPGENGVALDSRKREKQADSKKRAGRGLPEHPERQNSASKSPFPKLSSAVHAQTSNQSFKNSNLHHIPAPKRQACWRPQNRRYQCGFAIQNGNEQKTTNAANTQKLHRVPDPKITHFGHPKIADTSADLL